VAAGPSSNSQGRHTPLLRGSTRAVIESMLHGGDQDNRSCPSGVMIGSGRLKVNRETVLMLINWAFQSFLTAGAGETTDLRTRMWSKHPTRTPRGRSARDHRTGRHFDEAGDRDTAAAALVRARKVEKEILPKRRPPSTAP